MESMSKIFLILILCLNIKINSADNELMTVLEEKLEYKLSECTNYVAKWLEEFNDRHLGNSEIGRMLRYDVLKPMFGTTRKKTARESKSMKKMSMALIPLIFHIGATATFMILTSIMATKSVFIGLVLLVFKIAVSSAKVASFFTSMKAKSSDHHHDWSIPPHYEHHGHGRSLTDVGSYYPTSWSPYIPESHEISAPAYKTIPKHAQQYEQFEHKADVKKEHIAHS